MNNRIKQLAKKAGLLNRRFMFGQYYEDDLTDEQKKFAELVVQECLRAIQMESRECSGPDWEDGLLIAQGAIREHFGIRQ